MSSRCWAEVPHTLDLGYYNDTCAPWSRGFDRHADPAHRTPKILRTRVALRTRICTYESFGVKHATLGWGTHQRSFEDTHTRAQRVEARGFSRPEFCAMIAINPQ